MRRWHEAIAWDADRRARVTRLLRPRRIAVVGASPGPGFATSILRNLSGSADTEWVMAVNPKHRSIAGVPCVPSVRDLPGQPELVVVGVGHATVPRVLDDCEARGAGAVQILTSGYAELDAAGAARQADLTAWAHRTGIVLQGPNCLGLMHAPTGLNGLSTPFPRLHRGSVGLITQSGGMLPTLLALLFQREIGVTHGVTTGNEADLDLADYLRALVDDDETRIIGCFVEQIRSPERFIDACDDAAASGKQVVLLKIGASEASRRAALAHTGSVTGADAVMDAACEKLGIARVRSLDDMIEALAAFHRRVSPRGSRVVTVHASGGLAGLTADLATASGIVLEPLPAATAAALRESVFEYGTVGNPLDLTGQSVIRTDVLERALDIVAPVADVIVYGTSAILLIDGRWPMGAALQHAAARHPEVPFFVVTATSKGLAGDMMPGEGRAGAPPLETTLDGTPFLHGGEPGLRAVAAVMRMAEGARRRADAPPHRRLTRAAVPGLAGDDLLGHYGIPVARTKRARTAAEAAAAAAEIGWPVALKVDSPDIAHKTDAGGVRLGLTDAVAVAVAYDDLLLEVRRRAPHAAIDGVAVQEMVCGGTEMLVGFSRDATFGPVITCGLGGIFVEVLRDVQLLLPPFGPDECRERLRRLRGFPLLDGTRGRRPADVDALVDLLCRFGELAVDAGGAFDEIDLNPVIVGERGVRVVDALFVPAHG